MTWRITLTSGAEVYTDTPIDLDTLAANRWAAVQAIPRGVCGDILRNRPTSQMYLNIAQIVSIKEVDA